MPVAIIAIVLKEIGIINIYNLPVYIFIKSFVVRVILPYLLIIPTIIAGIICWIVSIYKILNTLIINCIIKAVYGPGLFHCYKIRLIDLTIPGFNVQAIFAGYIKIGNRQKIFPFTLLGKRVQFSLVIFDGYD